MDDHNNNTNATIRDYGLTTFVNPIVIIALLILFAIFVLIGSAIIGFDSVLIKMGRIEFARGLITYLFAVVTIGTAVVLVVSALTGTETPTHKERFQRGKEILSLLLGVFGTIVGFYFGSEVAHTQTQAPVVQIAPLRLSDQMGTSGGAVKLETFITGGTPPYRVGTGFDSEEVLPTDKYDATGWYSKMITLPTTTDEHAATIKVLAEDADGHRTEKSAPIILKPSASKQ